MTTRKEAVESGVRNAVDTVLLDKSMTAVDAYRMLESFVSDGLSCYGFGDVVAEEDLTYARSLWPLEG